MSGLTKRVLSAVLLLPLAVFVVLLGGWPFAVAAALLAGLMLVEWMGLTGPAGGVPARSTVPALLLALAVLAIADGRPSLAAAALLAAGLWNGLAERRAGRSALWGSAGVAWIGLPCVLAVWLRDAFPNGGWTVLWVLATVWAMDSGAYFAGRRFRGPLLAPRISPAKTWSGLLGGLAAAALLGAAVGWAAGGAVATTVALSVLLALVSHGGDLAESAVKRHFHKKDSGTLIPGHGGVLDRMDAQLFALPLAAGLALLKGGGLLPWR